LRQVSGLEPVIIRPPLVYGPGAKGNLARFCRLAQTGLPVPFAGIDNRRDLVGVVNLANLIERCVNHPAAAGQVFLASDGEALSTPQLYLAIAAAMGRPARMVKVPVNLMRALARSIGLSGEIDRLTESLELDVTKTRDLLGWQPPVSAAVGIAEMARAYRAGTG
jgi:nucleoside-diphosphate-sugar epimerase